MALDDKRGLSVTLILFFPFRMQTNLPTGSGAEHLIEGFNIIKMPIVMVDFFTTEAHVSLFPRTRYDLPQVGAARGAEMTEAVVASRKHERKIR